uniref:Uncharacterized protein n=1 Tax=Salix viminalis TaxID=40686 RepID=A0A6N2NGQ8_SALVM
MYFAKENAFPHVVLVSRADSISQHHLGSQLSQKAVHALSTPEHSHDHNYYPHTSTPDSKSRITLLPLPTRQSDSDGDFVVVASGGKGERQVSPSASSIVPPFTIHTKIPVIPVTTKPSQENRREKNEERKERKNSGQNLKQMILVRSVT